MIRPAPIGLAIPLIGFALVSCSPPPPAYTPAPPTSCGSDKVAKFVGKERTDAIAEQVAKLSGAKNIRWISPGMAVTMDYREDRLNVDLDDQGVITGVKCG